MKANSGQVQTVDTPLTVDTQELASREKALTEWYLGSACMKVNSGHIQTVDTQH